MGWDVAVRRAVRSLDNMGDETALDNEISMLNSAGAFGANYNNDYFYSLTQHLTTQNYDQFGPIVNYGVFAGIPYTDLGAAYGNLPFRINGRFSYENLSNGFIRWSTTVAFTFSDDYDFHGTDPVSAAFRRLQENGYATEYSTIGAFEMTFSGVAE